MLYIVVIGRRGEDELVNADSLADLANKLRGKHNGKRIRAWSQHGVLVIDTKFGDLYRLDTSIDCNERERLLNE